MAIDRIGEYRPIAPVNPTRREREGRRRTRREQRRERKPDDDKEHLIDERV